MRKFFRPEIFIRGLAMGAADVIPGVSGGTIAFITGIYEELIETIDSLDKSVLSVLKKDGLKTFWQTVNGSFLLSLILGIGISILSLANIVTYLLSNFPVLVSAFFFGLILASAVFIGKQITAWSWREIVALIFGITIAFSISLVSPTHGDASFLYLMLCGALAICAMILPGISGAFILLLLGQYKTVITAVKSLNISILIPVAIGAVIGIVSFSKVLNYLFKNYKNTTLALLTGFVIGALYKVWPWRKVLTTYTDSHGEIQPLKEEAISPFAYDGNPQTLAVFVLFLIGGGIVFLLERMGKR